MTVTPFARVTAIAVTGVVLLTGGSVPGRAESPRVVASILPVHSLVAGVMAGVGEPTLLVRGGGSPHRYTLRTSEAEALQEADVVFWVGEGLETFLEKPLEALPRDARVVALHEVEGVRLLPAREGGAWEGDGDHPEGDDHPGAHGSEHKHEHGSMDMHVWLDPGNAEAMVARIVVTLSEAAPAHADRFAANGDVLTGRLSDLDADLRQRLAPVAGRPYVVFHDAYHYFEARYGLSPVGSVTVSPDRLPGARTLMSIRERIIDSGAGCVFVEPQFEPAVVHAVTEGTGSRVAVLDPLGAGLEPGSDAYITLMRELAASLIGCLAEDR